MIDGMKHTPSVCAKSGAPPPRVNLEWQTDPEAVALRSCPRSFRLLLLTHPTSKIQDGLNNNKIRTNQRFLKAVKLSIPS